MHCNAIKQLSVSNGCNTWHYTEEQNITNAELYYAVIGAAQSRTKPHAKNTTLQYHQKACDTAVDYLL